MRGGGGEDEGRVGVLIKLTLGVMLGACLVLGAVVLCVLPAL